MFDRTFILPARAVEHRHHHRTDVHEHRAPTDDSVKLLKEMEQAAFDKIAGTLVVNDNSFSGKVLIRREMLNQTVHAVAICTINGREVRAEHQVETWMGQEREIREKLLTGLRDALATKIANEVMIEMTRRMRL